MLGDKLEMKVAVAVIADTVMHTANRVFTQSQQISYPSRF